MAFEAAKKERLLQLAAFDKGIWWACDQIAKTIESDLQVRESHGWPLDYKTLLSNTMAFLCGQNNRKRDGSQVASKRVYRMASKRDQKVDQS